MAGVLSQCTKTHLFYRKFPTFTPVRQMCTQDTEFKGKVDGEGHVHGSVKAPDKVPNYVARKFSWLALVFKPFLGMGVSYDGAANRWKVFWHGEGITRPRARFLKPPNISLVEENGVMIYYVPLAGFHKENMLVKNHGRSMKIHCSSSSVHIGDCEVEAELFYPYADRKLTSKDYKAYWNADMKVLIVEIYYYDAQVRVGDAGKSAAGKGDIGGEVKGEDVEE